MDYALEIAQKGFGWLVAVYLFVRLVGQYEKRIDDAKQSRDSVVEPMKNVQTTLDKIIGILQYTQKK